MKFVEKQKEKKLIVMYKNYILKDALNLKLFMIEVIKILIIISKYM